MRNDDVLAKRAKEVLSMSDFRKLAVWQSVQQLAVDVHRISETMRGVRNATLRNQLTRSAMSVPTNIVEGSAHGSPREFARFVRYAIASVSEVEGHAQMACDIGAIEPSELANLLPRIIEVRKMLYGLLKSLNKECSE